jgi:sugar phosphate isomerase/epimerase
MITDSLGGLTFDEMLKASAELGLETLEFACGNWSSAPHINLDEMLESESARKNFLAKVAAHGLEISALNCSGNPLHPGNKGKLHHEITLKTFRLAKLLKIDRIVMPIPTGS